MSLQLPPLANAQQAQAPDAPAAAQAPPPHRAQVPIPPPILAQRRENPAKRRSVAAAIREGARRARCLHEDARRDAEERRRNWANAVVNHRQELAPERGAEEEEEESPAFHPDWPHNLDDFPGEMTIQARRAARRTARPEDRPAAQEVAYCAMDEVFWHYPDEKPDGWNFGLDSIYPWHISYESETSTAWPLPNPLYLAEGCYSEALFRNVSVRRRHESEDETSSAESDATEQ